MANVRFGSKADIVQRARAMSALPPKADMCDAKPNVRFVPKADIANRLYFLTRRWMLPCAAE